ncbi:MAG: TraR/DksA family transcriptional regulator [Pseudobdellovibrio sp.]
MKTTENLGTDLNIIKQSLLIQKSEILNKNFEFKSQQSTLSKTTDEADAVVQELESNLSIQLHERDRHSLLLIDKALSKFATDSYGICESCDEAIDVRRLKARPLATLCISCMEDQESSRKNQMQ